MPDIYEKIKAIVDGENGIDKYRELFVGVLIANHYTGTSETSASIKRALTHSSNQSFNNLVGINTNKYYCKELEEVRMERLAIDTFLVYRGKPQDIPFCYKSSNLVLSDRIGNTDCLDNKDAKNYIDSEYKKYSIDVAAKAVVDIETHLQEFQKTFGYKLFFPMNTFEKYYTSKEMGCFKTKVITDTADLDMDILRYQKTRFNAEVINRLMNRFLNISSDNPDYIKRVKALELTRRKYDSIGSGTSLGVLKEPNIKNPAISNLLYSVFDIKTPVSAKSYDVIYALLNDKEILKWLG